MVFHTCYILFTDTVFTLSLYTQSSDALVLYWFQIVHNLMHDYMLLLMSLLMSAKLNVCLYVCGLESPKSMHLNKIQ